MFVAVMSYAQLDRAVRVAPAPVRALIERRQGCNHWAGEDRYDKARARQINAAARQLRCRQIAADEQAVRHAYRSQSNLAHLLDKTAEWSY